jgi:hypothetical protein
MDLGKSLSYPFEDNQWLSKLGLGAVISIVPILNFAWSGYMVDVLRNMMNNVQEPLPNWDDLGKKFMDGLVLVLAGLVYALPVLILACLPLGFMAVPAIMSGNSDMQGVAEALAGAGGVLLAGLMCVFALYALVLSAIYPVIFILYAREGTFASCFKLGEAFSLIGKNPGAFFTAWGVSILAGLGISLAVGIVQTVLGFIPCIGWIAALLISAVAVVYTSLVYTHLFGQFGQLSFGEKPLLTADQPM